MQALRDCGMMRVAKESDRFRMRCKFHALTIRKGLKHPACLESDTLLSREVSVRYTLVAMFLLCHT